MTVVEKIADDLAYRLPGSGKPLGHIVLPRAEAEQLLREIAPDIGGKLAGLLALIDEQLKTSFDDTRAGRDVWIVNAAELLRDSAATLRLMGRVLRRQLADIEQEHTP